MMSDLIQSLSSRLTLTFHTSKADALAHFTTVAFLSFVCRDGAGDLYSFSLPNDGVTKPWRDVMQPLFARDYVVLAIVNAWHISQQDWFTKDAVDAKRNLERSTDWCVAVGPFCGTQRRDRTRELSIRRISSRLHHLYPRWIHVGAAPAP